MSRKRAAIIIIAALAVAGVAVLAILFATASLQQDLAAYWIAGKARWLGLDPYVNQAGSAVAPRLWDGVAPYRHSRFLYPPLAAELFRLLAIIPYRFAKLAFTLAALAGWLLTARLVARRPGGRSEDALAVVIGGALWFPLTFHLERGQIDLLLLPLVFWAWLRRERVVAAGAALALAALFKPALLGALPVVVALGRWRWAAATLAFCGVAAVAGLVIGGPALTRAYVTEVLPRAVQYGEGGTEEMLVPEHELPSGDDGETTQLDGVTYKIALPPFDGPASASLPRRLSPGAPRWPTTLLPYPLVIAALAWAARRLQRPRAPGDALVVDDPALHDAQLLSFTAAILACVVTSPTGWVMSFVWALPIAPLVWASLARRRLRAPLLPAALGAAWLACALAPLISGAAAVSGLALVVFAAYAADAWTEAT